MKHTPAPWIVNRDYPSFIQIETEDQVSIADVDCAHMITMGVTASTPTDEQLANAELIAQAPVMYERIKELEAKNAKLEAEFLRALCS